MKRKFEKRYSLRVDLQQDDGDVFPYFVEDCDNFCSEQHPVPPFESRDQAMDAFVAMYTKNMCLEDRQRIKNVQIEEHMGVFDKNAQGEKQGGYKFSYLHEEGSVAMTGDTEDIVKSIKEENE